LIVPRLSALKCAMVVVLAILEFAIVALVGLAKLVNLRRAQILATTMVTASKENVIVVLASREKIAPSEHALQLTVQDTANA